LNLSKLKSIDANADIFCVQKSRDLLINRDDEKDISKGFNRNLFGIVIVTVTFEHEALFCNINLLLKSALL